MSLRPGAGCHTVLNLQESASIFTHSGLMLPIQRFLGFLFLLFDILSSTWKRLRGKRIKQL